MLQDEGAPAQSQNAPEPWNEPVATALLVLADGTVLEGFGIGQTGVADGEVCFNTAMTGYQEILTDPSYAGQIVTFTFPHIGNVGTNDEDLESLDAAPASGVRGAVIASAVTRPSNWRSSSHLDAWLKARGIVGITGVDTRALTARIRDNGMPNAVIANDPHGSFDREVLKARAAALAPMEGLDLVPPRGAFYALVDARRLCARLAIDDVRLVARPVEHRPQVVGHAAVDGDVGGDVRLDRLDRVERDGRVGDQDAAGLLHDAHVGAQVRADRLDLRPRVVLEARGALVGVGGAEAPAH